MGMKTVLDMEQRFIFLGSRKGLFKEPLPPRSLSATTVPKWKRR